MLRTASTTAERFSLRLTGSASIPFLLGKDRAKAAVAALVATEQGVNLMGSRAVLSERR